MKICPVGAELFHADGQTDGWTWRNQYSFFAILQTRLKMRHTIQLAMVFFTTKYTSKIININSYEQDGRRSHYSDWATAGEYRSLIPVGSGDFLSSKPSITPLAPTQHPIQWVRGFFPAGKAAGAWCWTFTFPAGKAPGGMMLNIHLHQAQRLWLKLYLYAPTRLHGVGRDSSEMGTFFACHVSVYLTFRRFALLEDF
jgi:hypothetical protein